MLSYPNAWSEHIYLCRCAVLVYVLRQKHGATATWQDARMRNVDWSHAAYYISLAALTFSSPLQQLQSDLSATQNVSSVCILLLTTMLLVFDKNET